MIGVPLDTKLNLLWAALTVVALAALSRTESCRPLKQASSRTSSRRLLCVLLFSLTLFPSISASDDLLAFSFLRFPMSGHGGLGNAPRDDTREKANLHLARLLQMPQNVQVARFHTFRPIFGSAAVSSDLRSLVNVYTTAYRSGRAPPRKISL